MNVKGTIDWVKEYNLRKHVIDKFAQTMNLYGFDMIEPSILERYELFIRTVGESSDIMQKEMFFAISQQNQDLNIVLRPEFTTSVIRSLIEAGEIHDRRISYFGKVFRHNRPQKGRYREFTQLGCEVFDDHPYIDIDVIASAVNFLNELGLKIKVKLNSLGSSETIAKYGIVLKEYMSNNNLTNDININPMRILDKMSNADQEKYDIPKIRQYMNDNDIKRFDIVCNGLEKQNIDFVIDEYLVRGLDYYNNTIFEIENESLDTQSSILGGGAYNGLVKKLGGPDIPGIGWSFGLERILMMNIQANSDEKRIVVISINEHDYALKVSNMLRNDSNMLNKKYKTITLFSDWKKSMKKLNKINPQYIVFCGNEEKIKNSVKLKNCETETQINVSYDNLIGIIK
ncbi:histidine--tRNA ligase [Candidatus Cytomitobacter primus]|uniref:Histidine--tRNA ligase n=1 Tax=Candidatus Cytomitobacter primus TaxID=2066024 RepID=A0A5C0UH80_9PROT|nr:histidine--tRNA ligase [Candidatus Cytomitobacter primus]QEK38404.1 histidine--tRNA ligase [Candidatus Cytomitobacter primus]